MGMFRKTMRFPGLMMPVLIIAFLGLLSGCGTGGLADAPAGSSSSGGTTGGTGGTDTGGTGSTPAPTQTADKIVLTPSPFSVKSGGGDTGKSSVTATVIDSNKVRIANMKVYFKITEGSGDLSAPFALTGANGEDATVTFSSGSNSLNGNTTIKASTDSGVYKDTTVVIYGTTLAKSTDLTNPTNDGTSKAKATLTITANDARGNPIRDVPITFSSISSSGGGTVAIYNVTGAALTDSTKNTDVYGKAIVTVEGRISGVVTVKAAVKTPADSVAPETSVTQDYTVVAPADVITIEEPATDTYSMNTTDSVTVKVRASAATTVRFAALQGYFDDDPTILTTVKNVFAGYASAKFSCTVAGFATIEVSDPNNPSGKDVLTVIVSAPLGAAPKIKLESSSANLPPSTGGVVNTVKLTATVTTASDARVANIPVAFSIVAKSTGGTEKISPLIAVTDGTGRVETTFTSGDLGSVGQGVTVQASLASDSSVKATTSIFITGTPGSVAIGRGTAVTDGNTYYKWPMVAIVADSGGHAVPNRIVSLKVWPSRYATGTWSYTINPVSGAQMFGYTRTTTQNNEDIDEDTIRDPGEDIHTPGMLTPPNSAAGVVPTTVMTDLEGKATFDLIYGKEYATWIEDRFTASIEVGGTETTSTVYFWLLPTSADVEAGKVFNSPFGP
jgi:hypothetical protein